jgi:hypothetical protein
VEICEEYDAEVVRMPDSRRDDARNRLSELAGNGWNMFVEPWEVMTSGHQSINSMSGDLCYASIVQNGLLTKEIRFWKKGRKFVNPVFEKISGGTDRQTAAFFYSSGRNDVEETLRLLNQWSVDQPTATEPCYYRACLALADGKYAEFLNLSHHYMALEKNQRSMSAVMNRYYYALVQVIHEKKVKSALQNLNLCICEKPLMAEFWCLTGDVFYHLLNKFSDARDFYENAMILGRHRLKTDKWPMDVSKYKSYPTKMITSCDQIAQHASTWGQYNTSR